MCFWATRGLKPEVREETEEEKMKFESMNLMEKLAAQAKGPKIHDFYEFNEGKEWFQDFYKQIWDKELKDNLYAVVQLLQ